MVPRRRLTGRLAALPPDVRRQALAHLGHLIRQERDRPSRGRGCPSCRERVAALKLAVREETEFPAEQCERCKTDWRELYGRIPWGPPGHVILPARRAILRFGLADVLEIPLRELPRDEVLVRGFAIADLVYDAEDEWPLILKALRRVFDGEPPQALESWEERVKDLERSVWTVKRNPERTIPPWHRWCRGDCYRPMSSNVLLAPADAERLKTERPELLEHASAMPHVEQLVELPSR